ncbi:hypothetical protein QEN19_002687 [Hanseniaspora menglaensis]
MNETSLELTQSITKLYSYLNTFNKNQNYYQNNEENNLYTFIRATCINEINIISNYFYKSKALNRTSIECPLKVDLVTCLLYWLESLLLFVQIDVDGKAIINMVTFVNKKNGRIDSLVVVLECISSMITLISDLLKIIESQKNDVISDFKKTLLQILNIVKSTLQHSKKLEASNDRNQNLEYIKYYKNFVNMINRNWVGKLTAVAFVFLSTEENKFDMLIENTILKYAFTLEMNGAIQAQKNIRKHKFIYSEYNTKADDLIGGTVYGNIIKIKVDGKFGYKINQIKNYHLNKILANEYSIIFDNVVQENNYFAFQYHLHRFFGGNENQNNDIFHYYQYVKHLQDFDRIIYLNNSKTNKTNSNNLLLLMNGGLGSGEKLSSAKNQLEETIDNVSKSFLMNWLDMHISMIVHIDAKYKKDTSQIKIKAILESAFFVFKSINVDFISHLQGKVLFAFIYEFCFFKFLQKLKSVDPFYLEFVCWDIVLRDLNSLIKSFDYNKVSLAISTFFNYWSYLPKFRKEEFIKVLIIENWQDILSPSVRGFSLVDIVLSKLIIYKKLYSMNQDLLKYLVDLELKNQHNKNIRVSIEYPHDPLILSNFRKPVLFIFPESQNTTFKRYDLRAENINKSLTKELPKIQVKNIIANKELPDPKSTNKLHKSQKTGSLFNNFINDLSKSITQFSQAKELPEENKCSNSSYKNDEDSLYADSITCSYLDEKHKQIHLQQKNPKYFFKLASLDTQLLEDYIDNDYNSLNISQEFKEAFKSMRSMLTYKKDTQDNSLIKALSYKAREIQAMKLSKEIELKNYNKKWNEQYQKVFAESSAQDSSQPHHNTIITSMDDFFISGDGYDTNFIDFEDSAQSDISSKLFKFIQDTNNQISESFDWGSDTLNSIKTNWGDELEIPNDLKISVMPALIKSHISDICSEKRASNNNVKKFISVFNKTVEEYEIVKKTLETCEEADDVGANIMFINDIFKLGN